MASNMSAKKETIDSVTEARIKAERQKMREVERLKEVKLKELIQRSKAKKENELVTVLKQ